MGVQHASAHHGASPFPQVRVFDQDAAGHDLLGSCEIPLHKITSAEHAKVENETGKHAGFHKGRVFKAKAMPLVLPGNKISSTIDLELYFCPDLPQDIVLEESAERAVKELGEVWGARSAPDCMCLRTAVKELGEIWGARSAPDCMCLRTVIVSSSGVGQPRQVILARHPERDPVPVARPFETRTLSRRAGLRDAPAGA